RPVRPNRIRGWCQTLFLVLTCCLRNQKQSLTPDELRQSLTPDELRHVVILNPASSVKGVKEQVIEGKTPEITLEQARTLLGSIKVAKTATNAQGEEVELPLTVG